MPTLNWIGKEAVVNHRLQVDLAQPQIVGPHVADPIRQLQFERHGILLGERQHRCMDALQRIANRHPLDREPEPPRLDPREIEHLAHATACMGVSTRVETTVAIELAAS